MIHVTYFDPEGWLGDEEERIPPDDDVFRRLLRIGADASWLAKTLNKENEE